MQEVVKRRGKELTRLHNYIDSTFEIENEKDRIVVHVTNEKKLQDAKEYYAASRITGLVKGFLARVIYRELLEELHATRVIQRVMRGKLGRMRWAYEYWKSISVVKSNEALAAILERSTITREATLVGALGYMWKEYFDPYTNSYWYYNKRNRLNTWECPLPLQKTMICHWDGFYSFGGLPSQKPCRQVFDNISSYHTHMKTAHKWYCTSCEHCNNCAAFPTCGLCGNTTSEDTEDGEQALKSSLANVRGRLNMFLINDKESKKEKYVIKDRLEQLAKEKINNKEEDYSMSTLWEAAKKVKKDPYARPETTVVTLPPITMNITSDQLARKVSKLKTSKMHAPQDPAFFHNDRPDIGEYAKDVGTVSKIGNAYAYHIRGGLEYEQKLLADPLDLGKIPFETFEDIVDEKLGRTKKVKIDRKKTRRSGLIDISDSSTFQADGIKNTKNFSDQSSVVKSLVENSDDDDDDDDEVEEVVDNASSVKDNFLLTAQLGEGKLLICRSFLAGVCTKTTCPLAHPGIRDSTEIFYTRLPGKAKKLPYCRLCPDCNGSTTFNCKEAMFCKLYHVYVRPSTRDIILKIYPCEKGVITKLYPSGSQITSNVVRKEFNGYGIFTWVMGATYMGDYKDGNRHGFGIYRTQSGNEYIGMWENGMRHGWGIMWTTNNEEYIGEWKFGKMDGVGQLRSATGDIYEGGFQNHKYHGIGSFIKSNGDAFVGTMVEGFAQGLGILQRFTGEKYKGHFDRNHRHGKGVCSYPNGSRYFGNWYRGYHEGFGIYLSPEGEKAIGQWAGGKKHGLMRYFFKNGDFYDGEFHKNLAQGKGAYFHVNGNIYTGEWHNNKRNGRGTYKFENGSKYTGNWVDNNIDGKGKFDFANGSFYRGCLKMNKKHGKGIYTWPNNNEYKGDFLNDRMTGFGIMNYAAGHVYTGHWLDNKKHGKGKFVYSYGHIYDGDWAYDVRQGKGLMRWLPGTLIQESYDGDWDNDEKHGEGKYIYREDEGTIYDGSWIRGMRHGKGRITYVDGSYYRGDFKKEQMWGKGVYVGSDGSQYDGEWRTNMRQGIGTTIATDGSIYQGEFWHNMRHGHGKVYYSDGSSYEGDWEGNVILGKGKFTVPCGQGSNKDGPSEVVVRVFGY